MVSDSHLGFKEKCTFGVFPPQLFDLSVDLWEMHNVAAANPSVVARMDATLRASIDYPTVMKGYEAQGEQSPSLHSS